MSENGNNNLVKENLIKEFTNYKGLIIQVTAFMFHSNNLYSDHPESNMFLIFVDYSIKAVLYMLFTFSFVRIILAKLNAIQITLRKTDNIIKWLFVIVVLFILIAVGSIVRFISLNSN